MINNLDELEAILRPVMKAVAVAVGPHCEVVLHDLSGHDMASSIAAIENGHVTGRKVGGPSTNLGLEMLREEEADHDEFGYKGRTGDGRELRSSSVYIRDEQGRVIAAFCINVDMTPLQAARANIEHLLGDEAPEREEIFATDIVEVLDNLIETAIEKTGKSVALMTKDDKLEVLKYLDEKGAFFVKRSVDRVARRLGVSRVTAYNYLDQLNDRRRSR
ncbi:helix-turn-helix transcriptional regulator [Nonomuraea lactucae]|uniref:helix-turn-helix transcriptional regulator n=1 Tax=Nonomuraea lactucae TaxID=2249762 RepID=UPI0013B3CBE6|nr:PAS domain-containing protein [Nonomuraea lactucae]